MISFDELFAYRIYYQDVSFDEFYIIKKLKQLLIDDGMEEGGANDHLFNFYTHFGHTISLEEIKSVNITPVVPLTQNNFLTSFFNYNQNIDNQNDNNQNDNNQNDNNQNDNNQNEYSGDQIEEEDEHHDNPNNPNDLSEESMEEEDHQDNPNELPELPNLEIPNNTENYPQMNLNFGMMPPTLNNTEILFTPINNNSGSSIVFEYSNLVDNNNLLGQLMNQIINTTNVNQPQEDINVTMDKEDINNLEILRYNEEEDSNCSICLMDLVKDDYYYKINCGHFFHRKCLEKWLEEYNYVCPVCRKELGKSKAHIGSGDNSNRNSSSSEGDFV
jgi:hypothetical protein